MRKASVLALTALALAGTGTAFAQAPKTAAPNVPADVAKAFDKQCAGCHTGLFAPKGLKLGPAKIAAAIDARPGSAIGVGGSPGRT